MHEGIFLQESKNQGTWDDSKAVDLQNQADLKVEKWKGPSMKINIQECGKITRL